MKDSPVYWFLAGPATLLLLLAALSSSMLILTAFARLPVVTSLAERSATCRIHGRIVPILWGVAAELLLVLCAGILFRVKILGLLGLVVLFLAFALAGLGLCLTAIRAGRALLNAFGEEGGDALCSLLVGLLVFLLAVIVPFVGWFVAAAATLAGVGVVLETLFRRDSSPFTPS